MSVFFLCTLFLKLTRDVLYFKGLKEGKTPAVGFSLICRRGFSGHMVLKYTILPRLGTKFTHTKVNIKVMGGAM